MIATYLVAALALYVGPASCDQVTDIIKKEIECTYAEKEYADAKFSKSNDGRTYAQNLQKCLTDLMGLAENYVKNEMDTKRINRVEYLNNHATKDLTSQSYFIQVTGAPDTGKKSITVKVPLPKKYQLEVEPDEYVMDQAAGKMFVKALVSTRNTDLDTRLELYKQFEGAGGGGGGVDMNEQPKSTSMLSKISRFFLAPLDYIKKFILGFRRLFGLGG